VLLATTPAAATALDPDRTRLLPPGIRMQRFARAPLPERTRILFVGSLTQKKGIRDLVEAFGLVHERVDDVELVLAGDGPEREWIADRARTLKLNGSLRVLGALPNERVPGLLAESSLLCLPSHGEPFGMAALEAMAAGRAVVGTDAGGLRELVDPVHGGRLVPVGSADELADTLVDLLSAPQLLSELGEFNRGRAEEQYALERVLDRLESVYAEAVS
jgi:glycosyltransferase involved in cell wall biosynthesis